MNIEKFIETNNFEKIEGFDSPVELMETLENKDLYDVDAERLIFNYSEEGAICEYSLAPEHLHEHYKYFLNSEENYFSSTFYGKGYIYDAGEDAYEYCSQSYNHTFLVIPCKKETTRKCKWILYEHRTICPENHTDVCDGSLDKPFWRLPERYKTVIKYCPYCGREIDFSDIEKSLQQF